MNIFILTTLFFVSSAFSSCPNGLVEDKFLNKCLTSDQVAIVRNGTKSCTPSDIECYKKNALDVLNSMTQDNNTPKGINKILGGEALKHSVSAAAIAAPLMMITSKIKGKVSGCSSISFGALVAGSAALVIGEHLANYQHKQRLKKIEEEWNKIVKPSGSSETNQEDKIHAGNNAQSEAFEMLARSEDSMVKAAKMKKTIFTAAGAAFGASAAMAIFEMTPWGQGQGMTLCKSKEDKLAEEKKLNESTKEANERIEKLISNEDKKKPSISDPNAKKSLEEVSQIPLEEDLKRTNLELSNKENELKNKYKYFEPTWRPGGDGVEVVTEDEKIKRGNERIILENEIADLKDRSDNLRNNINQLNNTNFTKPNTGIPDVTAPIIKPINNNQPQPNGIRNNPANQNTNNGQRATGWNGEQKNPANQNTNNGQRATGWNGEQNNPANQNTNNGQRATGWNGEQNNPANQNTNNGQRATGWNGEQKNPANQNTNNGQRATGWNGEQKNPANQNTNNGQRATGWNGEQNNPANQNTNNGQRATGWNGEQNNPANQNTNNGQRATGWNGEQKNPANQNTNNGQRATGWNGEQKNPANQNTNNGQRATGEAPEPNNNQTPPPASSPKINQFNIEKERIDNTIIKKITNHFKNISNLVFMSFQKINLIQESFAGDKSLPWNNIGLKLYTPLGRSIISGVLAGWSWVMVEHAKKQIEVSTNRAKLLRDMKQQFDATSASINPCTSQDRNDPGKPNCYCYNPDHSRNGSRSSTKVCQKLTVDTRVKASNYFGIDEGNFKGCISSNSQFDESCKCRQTNSCMKALKGSLNGLDAGSISMIKSGLEPLQKLTHGMMGSGSVDADGISTRAARIQTATEKLEEKVLTPTQKNEKKKLATQFEKESIKVASGLPSPLDTSTGSNLPSNPLDASKMLQSEIDKASSGDSNGDQGHSGSGSVALPSGGGNGTGDMGLGSGGSQEKLDFGLDTSASQEAEVAEVMKNEMDYGNNDVNTNSTSSLFEVLSHRYQKSGMKRLFESNE